MPQNGPTFDLQSHSLQSDGELSPAGVVAAAADAGVQLLSLTDHDSVAGVAEAVETAAALGVRLVTGVEVSTLDKDDQDFHVLGYLIDPDEPGLLAQLARSRSDREQRAQRMVSALTELGFELDERVLEARAAAGRAIGRPHLAQAVVNHPANAGRLEREGLGDATAFLVAYLIEGRPAYRSRVAPSVADAIDLIHDAGGIAIWAHPFWDVDAEQEVLATLERFAEMGLDGAEAFYITHTRGQAELLATRCQQLGLLSTGSSDFHGPTNRQFHRFRAFETYGLTPNLGPLTPG